MTSPTNGGLPMGGPLLRQSAASPYPPTGIKTVEQTQAEYYIEQLARQATAQERLLRILFDKTHPVDEYISSLGLPQPGNYDGAPYTGFVQLTRTWDMPERIESLIYTIPAGATSAVAKLGDRWINLMPAPTAASVLTLQNSGIVATPGAGGVIATVTVTGPALYSVATELQNIVAGTVNDNYGLFAQALLKFTYPYDAADTAVQTYPPVIVSVASATTSIKLEAIAADATGTYSGGIVVTPQAVTQSPLLAPYSNSFDGLGIVLDQDDDRFMLLQGTLSAGPTHFELMGFADEIYGAA